MAKNVIKLDDNDIFDFTLIGIICSQRDYQLCMALNNRLEINLSRCDDYTVFNNKRMETHSFSFYEYVNNEDRYNVISNKSLKGFLLPEQKQVDYLFILRLVQMKYNEQELISKLKEIPLILGAYKLEATKLKSKENLVF